MLYDMGNLLLTMKELQRGQRVTVVAFGGERLQRIVVSDLGQRVIVSNEHDFHSSITEGREPDGIGFPRKDVQILD